MSNPYHDAKGRFSRASASRAMRSANKIVRKVEVSGAHIASPKVALRTLSRGIAAAKYSGYKGDARIYKRVSRKLAKASRPTAKQVRQAEFRRQRRMQRLFGPDW